MFQSLSNTIVADQTTVDLLNDRAGLPELGTLAPPKQVKVDCPMSEGLTVCHFCSLIQHHDPGYHCL